MPKPNTELVPSHLDSERFLQLLVSLDTHRFTEGTLFESDVPSEDTRAELQQYVGQLMAVARIKDTSAVIERSVWNRRRQRYLHEAYVTEASGKLAAIYLQNEPVGVEGIAAHTCLHLVGQDSGTFHSSRIRYGVLDIVDRVALRPQIAVEFFQPAL